MKRGRAPLFIAVAAAVMLNSAVAFGSEICMSSHPDTKIRNGPATTYIVLWRPRLYTPFEILATFEDERKQLWYIIRDVEGDVGWVHYSTILKKPAAIVTSNMVNVHKAPSGNAQILYQAPKSFTFKILKSEGDWYEVQDPDGDKGWIEKKNVWTGDIPHPKKGSRKN